MQFFKNLSHVLISTVIVVVAGCSQFNADQPTALPDLHTGWVARPVDSVPQTGEQITAPGYQPSGWMPAKVPGTILTSLVEAGVYPDPYVGIQGMWPKDTGAMPYLGKRIPDLYEKYAAGDSSFYTYWFYNKFNLPSMGKDRRVWLRFRGINNDADVYFNGKNVGSHLQSMFLRHEIDLTGLTGTENRLAVLVRPPDPLQPGQFDPADTSGRSFGYPNGGKGGQSWTSISEKYSAGWDWIAPIADRNTGIWDKVDLKVTGPVIMRNPHFTATFPRPDYSVAGITATVEVTNASGSPQQGQIILKVTETGQSVQAGFQLAAGQTKLVQLPDISISQPKLWWPNGYGDPFRYTFSVDATVTGSGISDSDTTRFGIRDLQTKKVNYSGTNGITVTVNGQKIFIHGGNWIATDAMLRYSVKRYEDEVKYHKLMNLNLIRVWGGGITERPEFYEACDANGMMVMQDFWLSSEQNDAMPQPLYLESVRDRIKMLRNHASLAFWCGANETPHYGSVDDSTRCYITGKSLSGASCGPVLDGTRTYVSYSTCEKDGLGRMGSQWGDGPYGILNLNDIYSFNATVMQPSAFNPEIGSVGMVTEESIRTMMGNIDSFLTLPGQYIKSTNYGWAYHRYQPYASPQNNQVNLMNIYGKPVSLTDFCNKAQLANYAQYKAIMEGYNIQMWQQNSGALIWKSQSPWPELKAQLYDWYLEPTGGFFGVQEAAEMVHIQMDLSTNNVGIVNNSGSDITIKEIQYQVMDIAGKNVAKTMNPAVTINPSTYSVTGLNVAPQPGFNPIYFVRLQCVYALAGKTDTVSNFYWLSTTNNFEALQQMPQTTLATKVIRSSVRNGVYSADISFTNNGKMVSFWNRLQVKNTNAGTRVLPVFWSDNYFSLFPGETRTVHLEFSASDVKAGDTPVISWNGWNSGTGTLNVN